MSAAMESTRPDPFAQFKAMQREAWALFAPMETMTTIPAGKLVAFAGVQPGEEVLDVACGTGVVAVTAAGRGARVSALDLTPALLERARYNAGATGLDIAFTEGDAEALPYADARFDVVLSQFGHIFAPRPEVAIAEMLRVLRPGGRIAFSTWPPELLVGRQFAIMRRYAPTPPDGAPRPAAPEDWGDPEIVRQRLGDAVTDLRFDRDVMIAPSLGPAHTRAQLEDSIGIFKSIIAASKDDPARLAEIRETIDRLISEFFADNRLRQGFLMTRATKKA